MNNAIAEKRKQRSLVERLVGGPIGFRRLLLRLGPTFVKIGQFLALRPDLIPQAYSDELLGFFDDVEASPWTEVRRILEAEIGRIEQNFDSIDPLPVAAGSLAQVHRGVLPSGHIVAVKVLRPNIEDRITTDLGRARMLAWLLRLARLEFAIDPEEVVQELSEWLEREVDLRMELRNLQQLRELARDSDIELIPRPFPELSSRRVLTTEFVRGIPFSAILSPSVRGGRFTTEPQTWDLDPQLLAENLVHATLRQIFRYQFFHADVHPGNLIAHPEHIIGYVDFGLCESIDENVRKEQIRYLSAVYEGDVAGMFRALLEILEPGERADAESFRADFYEESAKWLRQSSYNTGVRPPEDGSPIAQWLIGVMRAARRNHFRIPPRLLAMYRTLLTAETVANRLDPHTDLRSVGRSFFVSLQVDDALRSIEPEEIEQGLPRALGLLRDAPGQLGQLLAELADGRFTLRVQSTDDMRTKREKDRRARLVATAVASVGFAFLFATPTLWQRGPAFLRWIAAGALAAVYFSMYLQWRRLR